MTNEKGEEPTMTEATAAPKATRAAKAEPHPSEGKNIIQILDAISREAGALEKEKGGAGVPFPYRGIDSTINHLSPLLRKYGVIFTDKVNHKDVISVPSGTRVVTTTNLTIEFTFYAPDMTSITTEVAGLANDFGDRSTAQSHSVALRIALLQLFALPTQSPDPEETSVQREAPQKVQAPLNPPESNGPTVKEAQTKVKEEWQALYAEDKDYSATGYISLGNKIFKTDNQNDWTGDINKLADVIVAIRKGEKA